MHQPPRREQKANQKTAIRGRLDAFVLCRDFLSNLYIIFFIDRWPNWTSPFSLFGFVLVVIAGIVCLVLVRVTLPDVLRGAWALLQNDFHRPRRCFWSHDNVYDRKRCKNKHANADYYQYAIQSDHFAV